MMPEPSRRCAALCGDLSLAKGVAPNAAGALPRGARHRERAPNAPDVAAPKGAPDRPLSARVVRQRALRAYPG